MLRGNSFCGLIGEGIMFIDCDRNRLSVGIDLRGKFLDCLLRSRSQFADLIK